METNQPYPDFGKWLTFTEAIKSSTAIRLGIDNRLKDTVIDGIHLSADQLYQNLLGVYNRFYAPACEHFGRKLPVDSVYRCPQLNKAIGGASASAHMFGCAIDIDCDGIGHPTNIELFTYFKNGYKFDQIIGEAPDVNNNFSWVHIATNRFGQADREEVMVMKRVNGKTIYVNV